MDLTKQTIKKDLKVQLEGDRFDYLTIKEKIIK